MDGGFGTGRGGRNGHSARGTWARRIAVGALASGTAAGLAGLGLSRARRRRRAAARFLPASMQTAVLLCAAGAVAAAALFRALARPRR
jgi:hypothetical protein